MDTYKTKELNKNILKGLTVYLAGPIDRAKDDGLTWRNEVKRKLKEKNIKVKVFDPTHKPKSLGTKIPSEIGEEKKLVKDLKRKGEWDKAAKIVNIYRRYDLRMVDTCNFFVIYIDTDIHSCGSYNELFLAETQHKPIFGIIKQKKEDLPDWLMDVINYNELFESVEEFIQYLMCLDNGEIELDDRWVKI